MNRRRFVARTALASAAALAAPPWAPTILTPRRTPVRTDAGTLLLRPHYVQKGRGPHLAPLVYASDTSWDPFRSDTRITESGVAISDAAGHDRFGLEVRWNVEGFGYTELTADGGGDFYELPPAGGTLELNLNYELARSRVAQNRRRRARFSLEDPTWQPERDVRGDLDVSEGYLEDAARVQGDEERRAELAQSALMHALRASEAMELDWARHRIVQRGARPGYYFGCDARSFYGMRTPEVFMERFLEAFNYATITYVWTHDGTIGDFERTEGAYNFEFRDAILRRMRGHDVTVEGRPLFWFHTWVTPEWVEAKSYDDLLRYVERHVRDVMTHYDDEIYAWEIVNEFHDWANDVELTPEQIVELTKLACDVARDVRPGVHRLINNCCPFAEYVGMGAWSGGPAKYRQRSPIQFTRDLVDAGVDFTHIGQQMYFPYRDLQDTVRLIERYEEFGRPVHLSEVGCSSGPSERSVRLGTVGFPNEPPVWHRPWDEALQADWLEGVYTLAYSKPYVEGCHWFDFVDTQSYLDNGGLFRTPDGEAKPAFDRLKALQAEWQALPQRDPTGCVRC